MRKLNLKQEKFAKEVVLNGGDKVKAYKVAGYKWQGYSKRALGVQADKLFNRPNINLRVKEFEKANAEVAKKEFNIDSSYVLRRLKEIDELDIIDILNDDLKSFKSLKEWPKVWRQNIEGIDLLTMTKDDEPFDSVLRKIKWPNKTKNLELIGKHVDVSAFSENINLKAKIKVDKSFNDFYDE